MFVFEYRIMSGVNIDMDMSATFFIDESGNTGTDWLNKEQPFFVYGGWLVLNEKIEEVNAYLKRFIIKEQSIELKSNKILKRKNGLYLCDEVFDILLRKFNAIPIFNVIDKKYMLAAKIVETFFDSAYNPNINEYLTYPVELKKALANCILKCEYILTDFSLLLKNGTIDISNLKKIASDLVSLFKEEDHPQVADSLMNLSDENFISMINEFETMTDIGKKKNRITLTQTVLVEMLKNIEMLCKTIGLRVNVIHDNLRGYSEVFNEIETTFFRKKDSNTYRFNDKIWMDGFTNIESISERDSKNTPFLQAADLLCGFISKSFQTMNLMENLSDIEKEKLKLLILMRDEFLKIHIYIWNYTMPYDFDRKLIQSINPYAKVNIKEYNEVIRNEFGKAII